VRDNLERVQPISPDDVAKKKAETIPDAVVAAWNRLIAEKWNGSSSRITQDEAVLAVMAAMRIESRREVFDKGYLEVEALYRSRNWKVVYDKPDYTESYSAFFVFSAKK
jgi:hypothetical protein